MLIIFLRATILYVALLVVMRLMGKRQIGEMQPFEFIITLLIAELACVPMTDVSIPLTYGLVSVLAVFVIHQLMSVLERTGENIKFLISGKPSVVITPNGVDFSQLKKNNLGIDDLIEAMRCAGYFSLDDLEYAIFESNGKLSAVEKQNDKNDSPSMPILIINEGKKNTHNMKLMKIDDEWLENNFKNQIKKIKDVQVLTIDQNGKAYLQLKNQKYKIINVQPTGVK